MIGLLILGVALPLFALVAYGVVATEGSREHVITGRRRARSLRPGRPTAATTRRVGWLTLAQTCALLAGLVLRALAHR